MKTILKVFFRTCARVVLRDPVVPHLSRSCLRLRPGRDRDSDRSARTGGSDSGFREERYHRSGDRVSHQSLRSAFAGGTSDRSASAFPLLDEGRNLRINSIRKRRGVSQPRAIFFYSLKEVPDGNDKNHSHAHEQGKKHCAKSFRQARLRHQSGEDR